MNQVNGAEVPIEINAAKIGPTILPCWANEIPINIAIIRIVPWNNESPIPDKGPIKATLTALIAPGSNVSGCSAYSSSMAIQIP